MVDQSRRRSFLLEPGESLLLARTGVEVALRFGAWERFTRLPASTIVSNPVVATPLIDYPAQDHPARAWQGVNPAALWHPLFWLPDRLSGRYQIQGSDGAVTMEGADTWAVRVCLELSMSGLYDAATGTWVDVLALHGLDIDDPAAIERVSRWQAGAPDPVLDGIDLGPVVDVEDADWALESALALVPDLRPASWAVLANDLLSQLDDIADPGSVTGGAAAHEAVGTIVTLGRTLLAAPDAGLGEAFWSRQDVELSMLDPGDAAAVIDGPLAEVSAALYDLRDANWQHLAALEAGFGREPEPAPAL